MFPVAGRRDKPLRSRAFAWKGLLRLDSLELASAYFREYVEHQHQLLREKESRRNLSYGRGLSFGAYAESTLDGWDDPAVQDLLRTVRRYFLLCEQRLRLQLIQWQPNCHLDQWSSLLAERGIAVFSSELAELLRSAPSDYQAFLGQSTSDLEDELPGFPELSQDNETPDPKTPAASTPTAAKDTRPRTVDVPRSSLPAGARRELKAKVMRLKKRLGGSVEVRLYRPRTSIGQGGGYGRVLCWLTAADGSQRRLYLLPGPNDQGEWWHRGY